MLTLNLGVQPGAPVQGGADLNINLAFNFVRDFAFVVLCIWLTISPQNGSNFFINGASFTPPTVPVLLQIISGANSAQDLLPSGSVYSLPHNSSIEITFPASAAAPGAPHPFHLHGVSAPYCSPYAHSCSYRGPPLARLRCRPQRRQHSLQLRQPRLARRR